MGERAPESFHLHTNYVIAEAHIRRMKGGAQSHLMRCSNKKNRDLYYVVKFTNNPQHRRILANELVGAHVAAFLGLPVAAPAIVSVGDCLVHREDGLRFELPKFRVQCNAGLQFGSKYQYDLRKDHVVHDLLPVEVVENLRDFLGMVVFDKWTCNTDGRQAVFLPLNDSYRYHDGCSYRSYRAVMIDQGFCFNAGEWNYPDAPLRGLYHRRHVYDQVVNIDSFEPWLTRLESPNTLRCIEGCFHAVPPEWYDYRFDEFSRLLECLIRRRSRVRSLIEDAAQIQNSPFPNWRKTCTVPVALAVGA